jgi:hypothetical protein
LLDPRLLCKIFGVQFASRILDLNKHIPMTFEPGKSGNPNGYKGPRDRARREVFERIKGLEHLDALETLSTIQNDSNTDPAIRVAAAAALAPYCHPKLQSIPTARYVELQLDVPEFTHVSDAENFLARIALLVARGHLDIQSAQELAGLVKLWIDSQYQKDELAFKISPPQTRDTTITIHGGLPSLPGAENLIMPQLNGHVVSEQLLSAPKDVVPPEPQDAQNGLPAPNEFTPGELKAQGPHPLQEHHFKPDPPSTGCAGEDAGKNSSTNGGGSGTPEQGP